MRFWSRAWSVVGMAAVVLCVLVGCAPAAQDEGRSRPVSMGRIGQTLPEFETAAAAVLDVYDLSVPILGVPSAALPQTDPGSWIVVAHCLRAEAEPPVAGIPVGALPREVVTEPILTAARAGAYTHHLEPVVADPPAQRRCE